MATAEITDLYAECRQTADQARQAATELASVNTSRKNAWLLESADALLKASPSILAANQQDLDAAESLGLSTAQVDRLRLDDDRIAGIAQGLRDVAALPDPCGELIEGRTSPAGLQIQRVRVALGVVFFIYESRPNVTADAAAICVKSGNAVILRGGKEAMHSSQAIIDVLRDVGQRQGMPRDMVQLVRTKDRAAVGHFLTMDDAIDVTIPRGGENLILRVTAEAKMPVIKHFHGNCHVYIDADADHEMAVRIVENAKCQRMGVCNACESLLVHQAAANEILPRIAAVLKKHGVEMRGDERSRAILPEMTRATETDFSTEYLGPTISVAVVDSVRGAAEHINRYGSHHTDAIVTNRLDASREFTTLVDSAAVIVNASTRFNDGSQLGLGAEIGISTDKLHARGPCGLRELTTYKYLVHGNGHIRS